MAPLTSSAPGKADCVVRRVEGPGQCHLLGFEGEREVSRLRIRTAQMMTATVVAAAGTPAVAGVALAMFSRVRPKATARKEIGADNSDHGWSVLGKPSRGQGPEAAEQEQRQCRHPQPQHHADQGDSRLGEHITDEVDTPYRGQSGIDQQYDQQSLEKPASRGPRGDCDWNGYAVSVVLSEFRTSRFLLSPLACGVV